MLFDTHLHLIYPERLNYPWLKDVPALNHPSTFDSYMQKARRLGITDCLHMEVDVDPKQIDAESEMVREHMEAPCGILRGAISACRPESSNFSRFLESAQQDTIIKGFRRVLHTMPDELSQTDMFRDNIKRLSHTGLTFDLCVLPQQLPIAAQLVDHCPDVQFILDHCGVPDIKGDAQSPWRDNLSELAKRSNVIAKISGIIAYGDANTWELEDLTPYFNHTVNTFGHNRIVWGSDSPVCNLGGGLEAWVGATHALTNNWGASDRHDLYQGNAEKIWA